MIKLVNDLAGVQQSESWMCTLKHFVIFWVHQRRDYHWPYCYEVKLSLCWVCLGSLPMDLLNWKDFRFKIVSPIEQLSQNIDIKDYEITMICTTIISQSYYTIFFYSTSICWSLTVYLSGFLKIVGRMEWEINYTYILSR